MGRRLGLTPLDGPLNGSGADRGTRTHTQYTLFDECIAPGPTPSGFAPLAGLSPVGFGVTRRVRTEPPHPSFSSPESACASGARRPQYPPPEWREYGRHGACVAHTKLSLPIPLPIPYQHTASSARLWRSSFPLSLPSPPPPFIGSLLSARHERQWSYSIKPSSVAGKQIFQPASVSPLSEIHSIGEPSGTIPSGPSVPQ